MREIGRPHKNLADTDPGTDPDPDTETLNSGRKYVNTGQTKVTY